MTKTKSPLVISDRTTMLILLAVVVIGALLFVRGKSVGDSPQQTPIVTQ